METGRLAKAAAALIRIASASLWRRDQLRGGKVFVIGRIIARDGAIDDEPAVARRPEGALVLALDHILDDELRQLDHEPAELGIFLAK